MSFWSVIFVVVPLLFVIYKYLTRHFNYFKEKGIPCEPAYPLVGGMGPIVLAQESFNDWSLKLAKKYSNNRLYGIIDFSGNPRYAIREPELVRELGIKSFDHFVDHETFGLEGVDRIFNEGLFNMKGQKWRDMRATLSPAFTGSKMRMMFELVNEICQETNEYLLKRYNSEKPLIIDVKDVTSKFTTNVISSCAFGMKIDSLSDPNNEIYVQAKKALDFQSVQTKIRFLLAKMIPGIMKFFRTGLIPTQSNDYFEGLFLQTIRERKEKKIFRPDVAQLLLQAWEGTLKHEEEKPTEDTGFAVVQESDLGRRKVERKWSETEIAAQAFLFLFAGSDTVSSAVQYTIYEVAINPDIQDTLLEEVDQILSDLEGKPINYEKLQKMQFLDAIISETLRMHVPVILDRVCEKTFTFEGDNGQMITMEKGSKLWFQTHDIMHNEKFYKNALKFDPWRFMGERKKEINPSAYLPFGIGPRNCIGSRFALMEVKGLLFNILSKFRLEVCDKTPIPFRYKKTFGNFPEDKIYVELRPRNKL